MEINNRDLNLKYYFLKIIKFKNNNFIQNMNLTTFLKVNLKKKFLLKDKFY